jgi:light-regulated signal transduction histidine kinase (bacteriophytochrome)
MHDHRGQLTGLIGISRDITDRKKAEALLREREEALRQLNTQLEQRVIDRTAQLEATNRELEAFAYSVSHDLRTPLRSIDGFSQALLEDYHTVLADEGQEFLRRIRASTQRMGGMIDGLLTLSRIARSELRVQPLNLSSMAAEVAAQLAEAEPDRQVEVVIQPNMMVNGDTRLMRIALQNLLENAWKYTRQQPHPRVEVRAQARGRGEMVFSVSDNGAGFDMAYAEKLFGAFQRLHTQSEFPGHGIGLATVQRIIHRHGGRIWAQARLGEGATFYFTL